MDESVDGSEFETDTSMSDGFISKLKSAEGKFNKAEGILSPKDGDYYLK